MSEVNLEVLRAKAEAEKRHAKDSASQLMAALKLGALAKRIGRKASGRVTRAGTAAVDTVQRHPGLTAAVATGAGLALTAKPIGRFLADEFVDTGSDEG